MLFVWALLAFFFGSVASSAERHRSARFVFGASLAAVFALFSILAGIDNMKSEVIDCRRVFDPNTGGDVLSCATDHWLPTRWWRLINPF